ncbi:hypothetical protein [Mesorhizobium sp. M1340]
MAASAVRADVRKCLNAKHLAMIENAKVEPQLALARGMMRSGEAF